MKTKSKFVEQSLVLVKPDGVQRGLVGEILSRFERKGLKIVAMKMVWPTKELAAKHYDQPESAMKMLGERTIAGFAERGVVDTRDPMDIARDIQKKLIRYLSAGPVVAMVIEGPHAVAFIRKLRGHMNPLQADVGTIISDYALDSYSIGDESSRAIRNLLHASGTPEEGQAEIKMWFKEDEIFEYNLAIEEVLYSVEWEGVREEIVGKKK